MGKNKDGKKRKAESQNISVSDNSSAGNNSSFMSTLLSGAVSSANRVIYGTPPGTNPNTSTPIPSGKAEHDSDLHSDLHAQLASQQKQLQETNTKLDTIITKLNKLDEIEAKLNHIENDVTAVKERVEKVEKQTNDLEHSVSFISNIVDEVNQDGGMAALRGKVSTNETKNKDLEATISSMSVAITELQEKCKDTGAGKVQMQKDLKRHENTIETVCASMDKLRRDRREMEDKVTDLQWRSMKNNLIFHGLLGESRQENVQDKLRQFVREELGIERRVEFGNVHRFGRYTRNKPRPIVARFIYNSDRALILDNSYKLRNSPWRITEQFPVAMEDRRRTLQPVARELRAQGHHTKFVRDKLIVDGVLYEDDGEEWEYTRVQEEAETHEQMDYHSGDGDGLDLR